jgi:beta-barrel assembly-enhancing protease
MISRFPKWLSAAVAFLVIAAWGMPANAISLKEEQELSQQFMRMVNRHFDLVDDPVIRSYIDQVGRRILAVLPPQPFAYRFHVIKEEAYNAFAIPAGYIFINSGLLLAMESEDELAGILSHEIAHVVCRHISQRIERSKKIDLASMAGVVAGIFLGVAAGSPEAAQALTLGAAAAGQTLTLAYSREDESQADQMGLAYLDKAGYSAQGLLEILKKIRGKQWFGSAQVPTYMMTHPAVEDRIVQIDTWMATRADPERRKRPPSAQFTRMQNRLRALYGDPEASMAHFRSALARNSSDDEALYGQALTLARTGNHVRAIELLQQVLTRHALDPAVLSDLGKLYFLSGRIQDSVNVLKGATSLSGVNLEGWFYLGRAYIELDDHAAAVDALERLLLMHDEYTPAYYFLGQAYGKLGRNPESHYYLGLFHFRKGDDRNARYHLLRARKDLDDPKKLETIKNILEILKELTKDEAR